MKIEKKVKGKGKAIIGIAMAVIMVTSLAAMVTPAAAFVRDARNVNDADPGPDGIWGTADDETIPPIAIGELVRITGPDGVLGTADDPTTLQKLEGIPLVPVGMIITAAGAGFDTAGASHGTYQSDQNTRVTLVEPVLDVKLQIGTLEVNSVVIGQRVDVVVDTNIPGAVGTVPPLAAPTGGPNDLKLEILDKNCGVYTTAGIGVPVAGAPAGTMWSVTTGPGGLPLGDYTFTVETYTTGAAVASIDIKSAEKDMTVRTLEILVEAEKTSIVELEKVRLTVVGAVMHSITISSSDPAHTIFPAGYEDNPPYDTSGFNDTIDSPDGIKEYVVYFNETGTYTITVTDTTAGLDDDIAITVSEKVVTFSMPSRCIIGRNLTIYGKANIGVTIDIAIDDYVTPDLNDIIIDEFGYFEEEIETDWMTPGAYRIKGFIDRAAGPGDVSGEEDDGATAILMVEEGLMVNLSPDMVPLGDNCDIYGTSFTNYVEIVTITPRGGNGTGIEGLYGVTIDTVPTSNYNFYKRIKVDSGADTGNYTILVLSSGRDSVYGNSAFKYIDNILDLDGAGPEPGVIDVSNKTQHEIVSIVKDVTIYQAGSDDLVWIGNIVVTQFDIFDTGPRPNPYPSIFGTHNGTIIPFYNINVSNIYTYPCPGTGGHTEHVKIWNTSNWNVTATWEGYVGDWHNISFNESFTLEAGKEYNYTIRTGSYPQIIHNQTHTTLDGSFINCTEFMDANGKRYNNWIPAIKLFK